MLFLILSIAIGGLLIGALGRLAVPGPQPMGILATMLVGIAGAVAGGIVSRIIWSDPQRHEVGVLVLEILGAALIVFAIRGRHRLGR